MAESELQREIMLAASKAGSRIFRNNTAYAWVGQVVERTQTAQGLRVVLIHAQPTHSGLIVGSSDLIGWTPVHNRALFTAIEVKYGRGQLTGPQRNFLTAVSAAGGIAIEARSVEQVLAVLARERTPT